MERQRPENKDGLSPQRETLKIHKPGEKFNLISREEDAKNEVTKHRQDRWHLVSICARRGTLCVVVTNGLSGRDSGRAQDIFITLALPPARRPLHFPGMPVCVHKDPGVCCIERENYPRTNHREATGIPTQASCPLSSGQWIQSLASPSLNFQMGSVPPWPHPSPLLPLAQSTAPVCMGVCSSVWPPWLPPEHLPLWSASSALTLSSDPRDFALAAPWCPQDPAKSLSILHKQH